MADFSDSPLLFQSGYASGWNAVGQIQKTRTINALNQGRISLAEAQSRLLRDGATPEELRALTGVNRQRTVQNALSGNGLTPLTQQMPQLHRGNPVTNALGRVGAAVGNIFHPQSRVAPTAAPAPAATPEPSTPAPAPQQQPGPQPTQAPQQAAAPAPQQPAPQQQPSAPMERDGDPSLAVPPGGEIAPLQQQPGQPGQDPHATIVEQMTGVSPNDFQRMRAAAEALWHAGDVEGALQYQDALEAMQTNATASYANLMGLVGRAATPLLRGGDTPEDNMERARTAHLILNNLEGLDADGNRVRQAMVDAQAPAWQSIRAAVASAANDGDGLTRQEVEDLRMQALSVEDNLNLQKDAAHNPRASIFDDDPEALRGVAYAVAMGLPLREFRMGSADNARVTAEAQHIARQLHLPEEFLVNARMAFDGNRTAMANLTRQGSAMFAAEQGADGAFELVLQELDAMESEGLTSDQPQLQQALMEWRRSWQPDEHGNLSRSSLEASRNSLQRGLTGRTARFYNLVTEAMMEYAKVLSGATGASGVTDSAMAEAANLMNAGMTPDRIRGAIQAARDLMHERMSGIDSAIDLIHSAASQGRSPSFADAAAGAAGGDYGGGGETDGGVDPEQLGDVAIPGARFDLMRLGADLSSVDNMSAGPERDALERRIMQQYSAPVPNNTQGARRHFRVEQLRMLHAVALTDRLISMYPDRAEEFAQHFADTHGGQTLEDMRAQVHRIFGTARRAAQPPSGGAARRPGYL